MAELPPTDNLGRRAPMAFVELLVAKTKAGKNRTKTHRHWWARCDECRQVTWVLGSRLPIKCRRTPRCGGKHRKVNQ